jgi:Glycosyl hydrolases family 38 N-terminal domain
MKGLNFRAALLYEQYGKHAKLFRHNVLLIVLGGDFRFDVMEEWAAQYENYKLLFEHMNARKEWNVRAQFGTFQQFFRALDEKTNNRDPGLFPSISGSLLLCILRLLLRRKAEINEFCADLQAISSPTTTGIATTGPDTSPHEPSTRQLTDGS